MPIYQLKNTKNATVTTKAVSAADTPRRSTVRRVRSQANTSSDEPSSPLISVRTSPSLLTGVACDDERQLNVAMDSGGGAASTFAGFSSPASRCRSSQVGGESFLQRGGRHHAGILRLIDGGTKRLSSLDEVGGEGSDSSGRRGGTARGRRFDERREEELQETPVKRKRPMIDMVEETIAAVGLAHLQALHDDVVEIDSNTSCRSFEERRRRHRSINNNNYNSKNKKSSSYNNHAQAHKPTNRRSTESSEFPISSPSDIQPWCSGGGAGGGARGTGKYAHRPALLKNALPTNCLERSLALLASQHKQMTIEEKLLAWPCSSDLSDVEDVNAFDEQFRKYEDDKRRELQQTKRKASKDTIDSVMAMLNKASDYDFAEFRAKLHAMVAPHSKKLGKEHDVNTLLGRERDSARSRDYGGGGGGSSSREKPSTSSAAAHLANQRRLRAAAGAETRKLRQQRDEDQRHFRRHSRTNKRHKPHSSTPPCSSSSDDNVACYPPLSAPPAQVLLAQVSSTQVPPPSHEDGEGTGAADAAIGGAKMPAACASLSKESQSLSPPPLKPCSRLPRPRHDLERRPPSQRLIQQRLDTNVDSKRFLLSPENKSAIFKTTSSKPSHNYTLALHPPLPSHERQPRGEIRRDLNQHHHNNKNNNSKLKNRRRSPRLRSPSASLAQLQSRSQETVPTQPPECVLLAKASAATICSGALPFHHKQDEFCNYLGLTGMSTANAVASAVAELAGSQTARRSIRVRRQQHQEKLERTKGVNEQANDDTEEAEEAEEGFPEERASMEYLRSPALTPAGKPAEIKILCHIASHKASRKGEVERVSKDCVKRITEPIRQQLILELRSRDATTLHCAAPADAHPAATNTNRTCPHFAQIDDVSEESGTGAGRGAVGESSESTHEAREKGGSTEYGAAKAMATPPAPEHERCDQHNLHSSPRSEYTRAPKPAVEVEKSLAVPEDIHERFHAYLAESRRSKPSIYIVEAMTSESGVQVQRHSPRQKEELDKKESPSPLVKKKKMVTLKLSPMCAEPVKSPRTIKCTERSPPPPRPPAPPKTVVKKQLRNQVVARSTTPVHILRVMRSTHSLRRGRRRIQVTTRQTATAGRLGKQISHNLLLRRAKAKDNLTKLLARQRQLQQQQLNETTSLVGGDKLCSTYVELCGRRKPAHKRGKAMSRAKGEPKSHSNSTTHTCDEPHDLKTTSAGANDDAESTRRKPPVRRQSVKVKARMAEPKASTPSRRSCSPSRKTRSASSSRKAHSSSPPAVPEDRESLGSSHASAKRKGGKSDAATKTPDNEMHRLNGGTCDPVADGESQRPRAAHLKNRATQSAFSSLRKGIRSVSDPKNPMRNPLNGDHGTVLYIYYELDMLIVVQERMVSFWKCSRLLNALAPINAPKQQTPPDGGDYGRPATPQPGEWQHLGECKRLSYDVEIPSPYANRICANNSVPVYLEMRCRELARERRDCNLLSVYINLYYFNDDEMHVKMHSVQLDAVQSLPKDVIYTTITESRYFVMAWPQENMLGKVHAGLCKYSLTPHLDTLASIREFKSMRREILSLECTDDDKLLGLGATELTIWDHRSGDVLMNYDLTMNLGRNLGSLFYPSQDFGQNHMLLLFQYANTAKHGGAKEDKAAIPTMTSLGSPLTHQTQPSSRPSSPCGESGGGAVLSVIACSISHSAPSHRILRRHHLPMPAFASIKQSMNTGHHLIVTGQNDEELWISCLDPTGMMLVPAQRTQRFYARGRNQLIELSERTLTVDSFANHVLKLAANAGKQLMT